ncbi:MAG TPA: SDR family NAD(P)-dependent oxidoreductase [Acidimicrobiales bacterium]|nr:SDR family NAD(P)-dependent oxidoreductase [Acidimicrobiales bacterium]
MTEVTPVTPGETTLEGRTALVTGAGRGLGRAYALHLARMGADVAVLDIDLHSYREYEAEQKLMTADTTADEVEALGRRSMAIEADVTDLAAMRDAIGRIRTGWEHLDIVVCNAGGGIGSPWEARASELDLEEFDAVVRKNLYGTVHTCVAAAPVLKEQRYGKIITVASISALRAGREGAYAHYGVAKAGIVMYTRYLAQDLGAWNITANCIAPGYVATGRLALTFDAMDDATKVSINTLNALGRPATPDDCARVVGFLAGPASDYLTGVVLPIDAGSVS